LWKPVNIASGSFSSASISIKKRAQKSRVHSTQRNICVLAGPRSQDRRPPGRTRAFSQERLAWNFPFIELRSKPRHGPTLSAFFENHRGDPSHRPLLSGSLGVESATLLGPFSSCLSRAVDVHENLHACVRPRPNGEVFAPPAHSSRFANSIFHVEPSKKGKKIKFMARLLVAFNRPPKRLVCERLNAETRLAVREFGRASRLLQIGAYLLSFLFPSFSAAPVTPWILSGPSPLR